MKNKKINKEKIIQLNAEGWNTVYISKSLKCSQSAVERFLKAHNLETNPTGFRGLMCWEWLRQIIYKYEVEEKSAKKIIDELGLTITENSIIDIVNKFGEKGSRKRGKKPAKVNEQYFDNIDSWEKAYIVGWLYSDGNVSYSKGHRIMQISLNKKDKNILDFIKRELNYEGSIQENHKRPEVYLQIYSDRLAASLEKYDIFPRKSLVCKPRFDKIPKEFHTDFIRGIIDGDGHISSYGYVCISGNKNTALSIKKWFEENSSIKPYAYMNKTSKVWVVRINTVKTTKEIYSMIWDNDKFCLLRKKNHIKEIINKSTPC